MEALGINLTQFIAQVINFLIVMLLLWKFAYNPILNLLNERQQKITQGLSDADQAAKDKEAAEIEAGKVLEKAYKDANEILKTARGSANLEAGEIIKKASEQAERIMKTAKEEAAGAKDKVLAEAKKELSEVVILALDKIVRDELSTDQKSKITSKAIAEI